MSNDYTLISDLNGSSGMPNQGMQMGMPNQGMQMGMPNQGMQMGMPNQGMDQMDMLRRYLAESGESDSDSDGSDSEDDSGHDNNNTWQHVYGVATLIMLAIILFYVFKIRKELIGMYEES